MVFKHDSFSRGDTKRCLTMRSVVKKAPVNSQQAFPAGMPNNAMMQMMMMGNGGNNPLQALDFVSQQFGMDPTLMRNFMAVQQARRNMGLGNQGGGDGANFGVPNGMGGFGGQFPQGPGNGNMGGMTSTDMFEAGLRLERMEQRQQYEQRQMQLMDMLNNNRSPQSSSNPPPSSYNNMGPGSSMGGAAGSAPSGTGNNNGGNNNNVSEISLASEIMKNNPSMEPRKALEMARNISKK